MPRPSFLHPKHAYKIASTHQKQQDTNFQAPDIFVVPPEEDETPPWCCYNAQQDTGSEDDYDYFARYPPVPTYTPYFHASAPGLDDFMPSRSKEPSETRSIVDALGDADDYLDNEFDHEHMGADLEDEDGDEFGLYGRSHKGSHYQRAYSTEPLSPQKEVGNDSDVVEIVRVRRRGADLGNTDDNFFGPSGNGFNNGLSAKSSFRSRATKAFRSLRGTIRPSSKSSSNYKDPVGSYTKPKSSSKLHTKLQTKPRAQDIFSPIENVPPPRESDTPDLNSQPSSHRSRLFLPTVKRRPSTPFFTTSRPELSAESQYTQEATFVNSNSSSATHGSSTTPPLCSSSSSHTHQVPTNQEVDDVPTPTRKSYQRQLQGPMPTDSWQASVAQEASRHIPLRSASSPTPLSRSPAPSPPTRQATRSFSVLNLHKIFHKSTSSSVSPDVSAPSTNSASSTCPSLSSTASTSEWSGRVTPPADSLPPTPTSVDMEVRRTNASAPEIGSSQHSSRQTPIASTSSSMRSVGSSGCTVNGRTSEELNGSTTPVPEFDLSPKVAHNLDLGLDINLTPSPSSIPSSRGKGKSKLRNGVGLSRSLSLKNIGSKLGLGKQAPPVPPLPVSGSPEDADTNLEMRLDSLYFDDLSFDTDKFVSR